MDTTTIPHKSIYSIAYFGTYASGKLLAGERMGFPCTATVPTWFTDSPTTCPIPCWYPALKPTTGAANQGTCAVGIQDGLGGAIVDWNADGSLGLVATGSLPNAIYATAGAEFIQAGSIELAGVAWSLIRQAQPLVGSAGHLTPVTMTSLHSQSPATTARPGTSSH